MSSFELSISVHAHKLTTQADSDVQRASYKQFFFDEVLQTKRLFFFPMEAMRASQITRLCIDSRRFNAARLLYNMRPMLARNHRIGAA
jgi:hypothetical protein